MNSYKPMKVTGMSTGLVQSREEFILPNDAYPTLINAFVWRERIKRKQGYRLLGRLQREVENVTLSTQADGSSYANADILADSGFSLRATEPNAQIIPGTVTIDVGAISFTDNGQSGLTATGGSGAINYVSGSLSLSFSPALGAPTDVVVGISYYPCLPVMGLRTKDITNINRTITIAFDTKYAYNFSGGAWGEWIPGTEWTGSNSDFFWSTNYFVSKDNLKIFWVTNDSGTTGDPIRYTDGIAWIDFAPTINAAGDDLYQCLALLPFRGRLLAFNTLEGSSLVASISYSQRIRWSAIGTPFSDTSSIVTSVNANAWRDDIRGQGGFLDIPISEDIIAVGFVRDNLVIYCESSTWQLRYTGRSIQPFQVEKVNTELGSESTFSAVQFDTSLVGIGDKGIVECDSFKSERIDIKIPDLVFGFNNNDDGPKRVHGIRDFIQKLCYWTYPEASGAVIYPNRRLVYNYENDSWAIFTDSLTCLGQFQPTTSRKWANINSPWIQQNYSWISTPVGNPLIAGGNQQGFIEILDQQTSNDVSLYIKGITGQSPSATIINSPDHNLSTGDVISISGIIGSDFTNLNGQIFGVSVIGRNTFYLYILDPSTGEFTIPQMDSSGTYLGGGQIAVRDGFSVVSKKFNFMDDGQSIQIGYIDVLTNTTTNGAMSMNVYLNYNDNEPSNTIPQNQNDQGPPDTFFNSIVPTTTSTLGITNTSKAWQRVFCPTRANFLTIEWTLSNSQLVGLEQESDVQIDAQVIWQRPAGRMTQI